MNSKPHKPKAAKKTPGTLLAEEMRAEGNKLTDVERERLGDAFMKLYWRRTQTGPNSSPLMPTSFLTWPMA